MIAKMRVFKVNLICIEEEGREGETVIAYRDKDDNLTLLNEDINHIYIAGEDISCVMSCVHPDSIKTVECLGGVAVCP